MRLHRSETLPSFLFVFGRETRPTLSKWQLKISSYHQNIDLAYGSFLCLAKKFLDGQKQGAGQVNCLGSLIYAHRLLYHCIYVGVMLCRESKQTPVHR